MARISGVNIPDNKHAVVSLTYVYGIGPSRAKHICQAVGVAEDTKVADLSEEQLDSVRNAVAKFIGLSKHNLCQITRVNESAGTYTVYRYCL